MASELDMQTVMLVVTEDCNLQCAYCYEKNKQPRTMSESLIQEIITRHMTQEDFKSVSFDLFGGEPLLEFATIRNVIEWFHQREWSKDHRFTISTNGTLFNDEMKEWLTKWKNCVIPLVSLDGAKAAHDANRCGSFDQVVRHVPFLRENWPTQPAKMTIGPSTIEHVAEGIKNIHSLGMLAEAAVVFEDVWGDAQAKEAALRVYEHELAKLVDFYEENPDLAPPMIVSRAVTGLLAEPEPDKRYCGAGKYMVCYTPDGVSYPCHRFAPLSSTRPCRNPYREQPEHVSDCGNCEECVLLRICPTCQGFNWEACGHTDRRTTYHCKFFKLEVLASAKLLVRGMKSKLQSEELSNEVARELAGQILAIQKLTDSGIYESIFD